MDTALIMPVIRHFMQLLAGYMLGWGFIREDMTEAVVGLGVSLFTLGWWYWSQRKKPEDHDPEDIRGV